MAREPTPSGPTSSSSPARAPQGGSGAPLSSVHEDMVPNERRSESMAVPPAARTAATAVASRSTAYMSTTVARPCPPCRPPIGASPSICQPSRATDHAAQPSRDPRLPLVDQLIDGLPAHWNLRSPKAGPSARRWSCWNPTARTASTAPLRLDAAGERTGKIRLSPHVHNTPQDITWSLPPSQCESAASQSLSPQSDGAPRSAMPRAIRQTELPEETGHFDSEWRTAMLREMRAPARLAPGVRGRHRRRGGTAGRRTSR